MARNSLDALREKLLISQHLESSDITRLVEWLEKQRDNSGFSADLISLDEVRGWNKDRRGNIAHSSGDFFSIEGVRIHFSKEREVSSWDQPIFNQKEGGILAILCAVFDDVVKFLLQAKAEPGNIGTLQFAPTLQATWSNLKRAHGGKRPPFAEFLLDESKGKLIYESLHNEEGGRFWKKSNSNQLLEIDPEMIELSENSPFIWVTLSQAKNLMLEDNIVNPFVKTILAPV